MKHTKIIGKRIKIKSGMIFSDGIGITRSMLMLAPESGEEILESIVESEISE
jgi:hypothetical protein